MELMSRAEVAKRLKMKPGTVESIERTAFKKILRDKGLCSRCIDLLGQLSSQPKTGDVPEREAHEILTDLGGSLLTWSDEFDDYIDV